MLKARNQNHRRHRRRRCSPHSPPHHFPSVGGRIARASAKKGERMEKQPSARKAGIGKRQYTDSLAVNSSSERESTEGDLSIASELERERALGLAMRRTCARPSSPWPSSLQALWRAFLPALSWPASSLQAFHPRTRSQTRPRHLGRRPRLLPGLFMLKSVP
jgi:hypothetical protein